MKPILLFRAQHHREEMTVASQYCDVYTSRTRIPPHSQVIGRYSCLPHYHELIDDLDYLQARLVNDLWMHEYVANSDYVYDITAFTFPTWFRLEEVPTHYRNQPLVVKGRTNSRKWQWNTHMYAKDFATAVALSAELANDPLLGPQGLLYRQYIPLERLETGINDLPMTNEWRIFYWKGRYLAHGFYWGILDDHDAIPCLEPDFLTHGLPMAQQVATIIADNASFFAIDVAKTEDGRWLVVEVNDGQQSGLNGTIDPHFFYQNLAKMVNDDYSA